ncbi:NAD(P)/FAD-dependent oxidoreductase [Bdellovibrionota bacterium FG-2]
MTESFDCLVVGLGVVGLSITRELALKGYHVVGIDAESRVGTGVSSRNSEVIHSGIHYPPGSLKARFCVRGRELIYSYSKEHDVPSRQTGKLVVATHASQGLLLEKLRLCGEANGVVGLELLSAEQVKRLEPQVSCACALHVPQTGIFDTHAFMLRLRTEAEAQGAMIALQAPFLGCEVACGFVARVGHPEGGSFELRARTLVNAAGLGAQKVAGLVQGMPSEKIPKRYLAKGSYFSHQGVSPFSRLVYPLPEQGALGIHSVVDLTGRVRFGPDIEYVDSENYEVDPVRAQFFSESVRKYFPAIQERALSPDFSGIRPKIHPPGTDSVDFRIDGSAVHGVSGLVNLFGIESPGLTSSLAIAEYVVEILKEVLG